MTMVEMCVHMDCAGCEARVRKALRKLDGVDGVEVDMAAQKVTVTGWADQRKVLRAVRKTGRRAVLWPYPHGAAADYQHYYHHHQAAPTMSMEGYYRHPACGPAPSSSYNYRKHGYDDFGLHGSGQRGAQPDAVDERARSLFSDENPHACSIM